MADTLSKLAKPAGATRTKKRLGRGVGSGLGKTSGRGQKGQYARNGVKRGFEGGQTPLMRRLPKRGFNVPDPIRTAEVNVGALEAKFDEGAEVDERALRDIGLIKGRADRVKILGDGELKKKLTVAAHVFSKSAADKIEKAGGKTVVVAPTSREPRSEEAQRKQSQA